MIVSLLLLVQKSSRTRMTILGRIPGTDRWKPINETSGAQEDMPGVLIVRIKDNLDFGMCFYPPGIILILLSSFSQYIPTKGTIASA